MTCYHSQDAVTWFRDNILNRHDTWTFMTFSYWCLVAVRNGQVKALQREMINSDRYVDIEDIY